MYKRQSVIRAAWGLSLAAATAMLCVPAQAQMNSDAGMPREKGVYLGAGLGANFQEDNRFPVAGGTTTSYNPGPVGVLSLGYAFGNGLRLELEPGYRYNDVDSITGSTVGGGRSQIFSTMANVLWDFNNFQAMGVPLVPHIGGGVGWAHIWDQEGPHGAGGLQVKGQNDAAAYQAIGGVEYGLTPQLKLGLDYRYFTARDTFLRVNTTGGPRTNVGDFNDHAILFTVRYSFGSPEARPMPAQIPPATPAAAPAAVAHQYAVYFDFDRSDLTPDAKPILQRAATDAKAGNVTRVQVTGHTDRAGPDNYNQRLSERRAQAVKAELISQGVRADEIVTVGKGESEPAVPTPDGVREPRNRRVVIELQGAGA
jgi:OmpA-OmpF porin, OOP family